MICRMAAITAAALLVSATASANLLLQPSFEVSEGTPSAVGPDIMTLTPGSAWSGWNTWVDPYGAYVTDSQARTGTQAGKTFGAPNSGIYQFVPATAGETYEASAYFLNSTGDPIVTQTLDVRLQFRDAANVNIGGAVISPLLTADMPKDVWTLASVQATAPVGTASVQFMMFMNNPVGSGGAMFVDDASLVVVPEPTALGAIGLCALGMLRRRSE